MLPTLFGSSVSQINALVDTLIASFLAFGSISWLYYADRLMEISTGCIRYCAWHRAAARTGTLPCSR